MFKYNCLNAISEVGLKNFTEDFTQTDNIDEAAAILVRSAAMHDMSFSDNLLAIARAGAGVNNIPLDKCAEQGIVVFNTPGANANGVKELVVAAMLLSARDLLGGNAWVAENKDDDNIGKTMEKICEWSKYDLNNTDMIGITQNQIEEFLKDMTWKL